MFGVTLLEMMTLPPSTDVWMFGVTLLEMMTLPPSTDVWMFGVTLWEMMTFGEEPWVGLNGAQILQKIDSEGERLRQPDACSDQLYQLMLQCWSHRLVPRLIPGSQDGSERSTHDLRTGDCMGRRADGKDLNV